MSDDKVLYLSFLCAATSLVLIWRWGRGETAGRRFPPGPRGLPLLGNVLDLSKDVPIWQTFQSMAQDYHTDVLYIRLLTTDLVVLNSSEAISDLVEKRSTIYSNRPSIPMVNLMIQDLWHIAFMEYGSKWRNGRRLLHDFLNPKAVTRFDGYQRKHAHHLLLRLVEFPDDFLDHINFAVGALVMEVTYGMNIATHEDQFLRAAKEAVGLITRATMPGIFLVNTIPILKYVPEWVPGAGFKTFAREARGNVELAVDGPLECVKESMRSCKGSNASMAWSFFDQALEYGNQGLDESAIRSATGSMYTAVETTVAALRTFFLAMALNPHVMSKAQEELDRVIGDERLPEFTEQVDLPYISAIAKETLRWGCPAPIGIPKQVMEDDVYNGHFIPAGANIIENVWAMFYDESIYPVPHKFDPERFLKSGKLDHSLKDPEERIFGSGRRICPGRHFAMRIIFLNIACILTLFNIEAPTGEILEAKFSEDSILREPTPFKCTIRPRSEASWKLVKSVRAETDQ